MSALRLGTRRSALATTQSGWVADLLRARGHEVELVEIVSEGDVNTAPLTEIGGTGVFASALRNALRAGRVDVAVHSLKDLPVAPEPGLLIEAIPAREDPRDVLVARDGMTLEQLPQGARIGTGSPRRAAQLVRTRPDLVVEGIRGNVESRVRTVTGGTMHAVVLAGAGLRRLGREADITQVIDLDVMLPAPGQGALAVECRQDDEQIRRVLAELDDAPTRVGVTAERALLAALEAGCTAPIGAHARPEGDTLHLQGFAGAEDASFAVRDAISGPADDPWALGRALAARMRAAGADRLGGVGRSSVATPSHRPPASTGAPTRDDALAHAQTHQEHNP